MNRIIKKFVMFVLPFLFLFINVSYANEFASTPFSDLNSSITLTQGKANDSFHSGVLYGDYTLTQISQIVANYYNNVSDSETSYNTMLSNLTSNGYDFTLLNWSASGVSKPYRYVLMKKGYFDIGIYITSSNTKYLVVSPLVDNFNNITDFVYANSSISSNTYTVYYIGHNSSQTINDIYSGSINSEITDYINYSTVSIKKIINNSGLIWDGTYYYKVESDEPDTPSLPSNAEIAQAVQLFYNTIYNQPNISFDDFIVLYDNSTGLYSYIGHTRGNAIGQVIVEPNGYYNGYKFDTQWWQFFLDEQNDSWEWENLTKYNNYFLYSSEGTIDSLKYVGQDKISNLFTAGPWATSNTIIVYSTNDYPVKYITFSDESPDPIVETGTIKGDQYTYDENIDITDNQYNPLDNFVSVDYPSSLVSRADFDEFMKTFDENKDFLILPADSNWIVIACESLFGYFSSFIVMCAVFIIVERIMRG